MHGSTDAQGGREAQEAQREQAERVARASQQRAGATSSARPPEDSRRERSALILMLGDRRARSLRRLLLVLIALFYIASVPWYRETGAAFGIAFGLPDWVAVALGCYFAVAVLNALAWQLTEVSDPMPVDVPSHDDGSER